MTWTAIHARPLAYATITCTCDVPVSELDEPGDEYTCPRCHQEWRYYTPPDGTPPRRPKDTRP